MAWILFHSWTLSWLTLSFPLERLIMRIISEEQPIVVLKQVIAINDSHSC
jgi:hypothetical protein